MNIGQRVEVCRGRNKGKRGVIVRYSMGDYVVQLDGDQGVLVLGRRSVKAVKPQGY